MTGKRICAWCRRVIGEIPELTNGDTHGICLTCSLILQCQQQPITRYACKQRCETTGQPAPGRCKHGAMAV